MISLAGEKAAETKTTLTQLSVKGGRGWGSRCGIILLLSWHSGSHLTPKKASLCLAACGCEGDQGEGDQGPRLWRRPRSRRSGQACPERLMAWRGSPSCMAPGAVGASLMSPSLRDVNHHPADDTGTPGRQNPQKTPSQFSWQALDKSSHPLKTSPGL